MMPTYAQLQAEQWWGREIVTDEMDWLGDELCRRTGRPRTAFGAKGDDNHLRGSHRSQEWILRSRYATSRTYTVQTNLTANQARHIAGIDFTPGSAGEMITQCKRLYAALRAGRLEEVREFYGNVDGDKVVDGWDNIRDRPATSDSSHLWHWHLGLDRRHCADRRLMERILAIVLGDDDQEDDMIGAKKGDQGSRVAALQYALIEAGFDPGPTDGRYGDKTAAAVLAMRKAAGSVAAKDGNELTPAAYGQLLRMIAKRHGGAGKQGPTGPQGPAGPAGPQGPRGEVDYERLVAELLHRLAKSDGPPVGQE